MFFLIGIGLNLNQITKEAEEAISLCDEIYLEDYTSFYAGTNPFEENKISIKDKKIKILSRKETESSFLIEKAKEKNIALLVYGNPLNATTHFQLIADCIKEKINYKIIAGIGIFSFLGITGLDPYKFGRTITIVYPEKNYKPTSFFNQLEKNLNSGLHTLCLLDIKREEKKFMTAKEGLNLLYQIAKEKQTSILDEKLPIALIAVGSPKEKILYGKEQIEAFNKEIYPQSLIIAGSLSNKEEEFISLLREKYG